uniref:Receptor activity-modifying protein 3-like n=1 Tax=Acanthochromis polyacanthus TaxID=80966 RepID=A0A3Q1FW50_9TELE
NKVFNNRLPCRPSTLAGIVDLQAANLTERNQTFTLSTNNNNTRKPNNVTSSLYSDEKTQIEDELESNYTSAVITEDDESFQEQENIFPGQHCHQELLAESTHYCGETFHQEMESISPEKWCILENVIRPYHEMTNCLEKLTRLFGCYFPNPDIQDFFLFIHSTYFHNCSKGGEGEEFLEDAPHSLVVVLTIIPVGFVLVLIYLVVWMSKVQD